MSEYMIVHSRDRDWFELAVSNHMDYGWMPVGGLVTREDKGSVGEFLQTMVRIEQDVKQDTGPR